LDGRFVLLFEAGRGGMGSVYAARDQVTGAQVAVKLLHADLTDANAAERFRREAEFLATLSHPGIVSYIAHGIAEGAELGAGAHRPYLVMEWLTGEDLCRRLRAGPLSIPESLCLLRAAARALGSVHRAGIIHRGIAP
jgi:serine/threonine protein kinase